jgi:hypothetical protein
MHCAKKLGEGGRDVLSIAETFRRNPAGNQSRLVELASSQKRVLRGAAKSALRSVDSECRCRVIEPRNYLSWRALVVVCAWGRAELPQWPGSVGLAGVQEQGAGTKGFPGNLGGPDGLQTFYAGIGDPVINPWPAASCPGPQGAKAQAQRLVAPSEGNEARREGPRESHSVIVPSQLGNSPRRTQ